MKRYRVTIETARDQYQYEVAASTKAKAITIAQDLATADGWSGYHLGISAERI